MFENLLCHRLISSTAEKLNPNQQGFRSRRSCETAASLFIKRAYDSTDKRSGNVIAVFIDFTKAFDSLNKIFLSKLMEKFNNRVEPALVKLLQNYFTNRKFPVRNFNFESKEFNNYSGTPAGSCLGALTF